MNSLKDVVISGLQEPMPFDTSSGSVSYLLVTKNGAHIKVSSKVYEIIHQIEMGISKAEIAHNLSIKFDCNVTENEVNATYNGLVGRLQAIDAKKNILPLGFWGHLPIFQENLVASIADVLSIAFKPLIAASLLVTALIFMLVIIPLSIRNDFSLYFGSQAFWTGYVLLLLSGLFHELGHASGCYYYGAKPGHIAIAFYWIFPVFYTDVTRAWALKRQERVIIDLAGIYFQLVIGVMYLVAYGLLGWEALRIGFLLILLSCLFNLNPILKLDGYWALSDALGVENLGDQSPLLIQNLRMLFRKNSSKSFQENKSLILVLYSLATFVFWAGAIWFMIPLISRHLINFPGLVTHMFNEIVMRHQVRGTDAAEFLSASFVICGTLLMARYVLSVFLEARPSGKASHGDSSLASGK